MISGVGRWRRQGSRWFGGDCLATPPEDIFTWFRATVRVDGEAYTDVGVRKKGFLGSMSEARPALKVRFDKFVNDQLLGGVMQRLTLNNALQDGSMLNTCMALRIFADAGLPTPRCSFATVSANGKKLGLYVHVESVKDAFLERSFPDPTGNLYEGTVSDFRPGWRGTFAKKTNEDAADWSDLDAVVEALLQASADWLAGDPSAAGLDGLRAIVDLDSFLTFWAICRSSWTRTVGRASPSAAASSWASGPSMESWSPRSTGRTGRPMRERASRACPTLRATTRP